MKRILIGVAALVLLFASPAPANDDNAPWLKSDTSYYFAVGQGIFRPPVWLLAWEGTIEGDINGVIRWWIDTTETVFPDYVGRWELLNCLPPTAPIDCPHDSALVMMAGYSAGTNFPSDGVTTDWAGKGIVTFAAPQYAKWFGRRITEGGTYYLVDGNPVAGVGPFVIYDRPSNKH